MNRPAVIACVGAVEDEALGFMVWNLAGVVSDDGHTVLVLDVTESGALTQLVFDEQQRREWEWQAPVVGVRAWLMGSVSNNALQEVDRDLWVLPAAPAAGDGIGYVATDVLRRGLDALAEEIGADVVLLATGVRHRAHLWPLLGLAEQVLVVARSSPDGIQALRGLGRELYGGLSTEEGSTPRLAGYVELNSADPGATTAAAMAGAEWSKALPAVFRDAVVLGRAEEFGVEAVNDPMCLGRALHHHGLLRLSRSSRRPVSRLSAADGLDPPLGKAARRQAAILRSTASRLGLIPPMSAPQATRPPVRGASPTRWHRYWLPATGVDPASVIAGGYLIDPESLEGHYRADALFDRDDLDPFRSLVLLGEPGIGKTTALESWCASGPSTVILGSEIDDRRDLDEALDRWPGDRPLHIDGLDESGLFRQKPRRFLKILGAAFEQAPKPALRLTCRSASWTPAIQDALNRSIPPKLVEAQAHQVFILAPLTRADVKAYAAERIDDADRWLARIDGLHLGPSAAHPFSLTRLYLPEGQPPAPFDATPWDLHERAASALCRFPDHDREAGDQPHRRLSAGGRLDVASFIAFARVMTSRGTFGAATGSGPGLTVDDLADAGPHGLPDIRETLDCPLFAGPGDSRRFVHESFADFLAARYAATSLEPAAMWDAARNRHGRIPEPLFEMVAWLGQRVRWISERLRREAPLRVLERGPFLDEGARRQLLAELVSRHRRGELDLSVQYRALLNLAGPGMEADVSALLDEQDDRLVDAAAFLAQHSGYSSLAPELVAIALDGGRSLTSRTSALDALARVGGEFDRAQLRIVLPDPNGVDTPGAGHYAEDIVAAALPILWPDHLSIDELLGHFRPPRGLGRWRYDWHQLVDSFSPEHLPVVLDWALDDIDDRGYMSNLERFADSVARRCWAFLRPGPMLSALGRALRWRGNKLEIDWSSDDRRRSLILRELLSEPDGLRWGWDKLGALGLLQLEDAPFIVARAEDAHGDDQALWVSMLRLIFRRPEHDDLIDRARALPGFGAHLDVYDRTIGGQLDPRPYVEEHRARVDRRRRWAPHPDKVEEPTIAAALDAIEADADHGWLMLDIAMEGRLGHGWSLEGRALDAMTEAEARRLLGYARSTVQRGPADADLDLGRRELRAWELLSTAAPEQVASLPPETWRAWLPVLIRRLYSGDARLHRLALDIAPEAWCEAWIEAYRAAAGAASAGGHALRQVLGAAAAAYAAPVEAAAVGLLDDPSLPLMQRIPLLRLLLPKRVEAAYRWAESHFDETRIAFELLQSDPARIWPRFWRRMQSEPGWGQQLWRESGLFTRRLDFTDGLPSPARAELAWWLLQHFEPARAPDGVPLTGTLDDWLHSEAARLIQTMVQTGEVDGISRLVQLDPSPHMRERLTRTQRNADAREWVPFDPARITTLIRPPGTSAELADAVLRALDLIQRERLDGEYAEPASFWDRQGPHGKTRRPKSEVDLSYWLRNRLADRLPSAAGLTIDPETDVAGGQRRTDIRVRLTTPEASMTVIIEAKGCWHREVISSVRDQLAGEYLARMPGASGIHVVWWFDHGNWTDATDSRRHQVKADYRHHPGLLADALAREVEAVAHSTGRDLRSVVLRVSNSPPALEHESEGRPDA